MINTYFLWNGYRWRYLGDTEDLIAELARHFYIAFDHNGVTTYENKWFSDPNLHFVDNDNQRIDPKDFYDEAYAVFIDMLRHKPAEPIIKTSVKPKIIKRNPKKSF